MTKKDILMEPYSALRLPSSHYKKRTFNIELMIKNGYWKIVEDSFSQRNNIDKNEQYKRFKQHT